MKKLCFALLFLPSLLFGAGSSINNSQAALTTTAALVAAFDSTRDNILIRNLDAAISIYVGKTGVTSATGMLVKAGESITISTTGQVYAVAASGTPSIAILTENR